VLGVIVEVQLGRDEDKSYAWPACITIFALGSVACSRFRSRRNGAGLRPTASPNGETAGGCAGPGSLGVGIEYFHKMPIGVYSLVLLLSG
jgi:hypothetical protein